MMVTAAHVSLPAVFPDTAKRNTFLSTLYLRAFGRVQSRGPAKPRFQCLSSGEVPDRFLREGTKVQGRKGDDRRGMEANAAAMPVSGRSTGVIGKFTMSKSRIVRATRRIPQEILHCESYWFHFCSKFFPCFGCAIIGKLPARPRRLGESCFPWHRRTWPIRPALPKSA